MMSEQPIRHRWSKHYQTLEEIRQEGIVNMWGAAPILSERDNISQRLANEILSSWIANYDAISKIYGWKK